MRDERTRQRQRRILRSAQPGSLDWQQTATCATLTTWNTADVDDQIDTCRTCPVRVECLVHAATSEPYAEGVWGGVDWYEGRLHVSIGDADDLRGLARLVSLVVGKAHPLVAQLTRAARSVAA